MGLFPSSAASSRLLGRGAGGRAMVVTASKSRWERLRHYARVARRCQDLGTCQGESPVSVRRSPHHLLPLVMPWRNCLDAAMATW